MIPMVRHSPPIMHAAVVALVAPGDIVAGRLARRTLPFLLLLHQLMLKLHLISLTGHVLGQIADIESLSR